MKKVSWKYILFLIGSVLGISAIISMIMSSSWADVDAFIGNMILFVTLIGFVVFLFNIDTNFITKRLMKKAIEKSEETIDLQNCSTFTTNNAILKIDSINGKIGYICNLNPMKLQVVSAKDITNIVSDYVKAPFGGTNCVYFQFAFEGKRFRIPTFTARKVVYSLQSMEVLEAISKADAYAELLQHAKSVAMQEK